MPCCQSLNKSFFPTGAGSCIRQEARLYLWVREEAPGLHSARPPSAAEVPAMTSLHAKGLEPKAPTGLKAPQLWACLWPLKLGAHSSINLCSWVWVCFLSHIAHLFIPESLHTNTLKLRPSLLLSLLPRCRHPPYRSAYTDLLSRSPSDSGCLNRPFTWEAVHHPGFSGLSLTSWRL